MARMPLEAWKDTCDTLHMWMQIVGKIRLKVIPRLHHWWEVPFHERRVSVAEVGAPIERSIGSQR